MAKGIENRARSPPSVFDFATSKIQKHGGTKMYYDLVESGKRIKALRKKHGLTQEQLAERAGIHVNTIRKYELGYRKPKIAQLKKIAGGLEISVIEFLDIEIENEADLIAVLKKISPFFKWEAFAGLFGRE